MDQIAGWVPEAIPLLAAAANDYMTTVEDVFHEASPAARAPQETVDFQLLRKELGV